MLLGKNKLRGQEGVEERRIGGGDHEIENNDASLGTWMVEGA